MSHHHPTHHRRRLGSLILTFVALGGGAASAGQPTTPVTNSEICVIRPEPDAMPTYAGLGGTTVVTNGQLAVLHRIECNGRPTSWRWLTANDILH